MKSVYCVRTERDSLFRHMKALSEMRASSTHPFAHSTASGAVSGTERGDIGRTRSMKRVYCLSTYKDPLWVIGFDHRHFLSPAV
jgi:hypothetical protein